MAKTELETELFLLELNADNSTDGVFLERASSVDQDIFEMKSQGTECQPERPGDSMSDDSGEPNVVSKCLPGIECPIRGKMTGGIKDWDATAVASWFETVELDVVAKRMYQHGITGKLVQSRVRVDSLNTLVL